MSNLCFLAFSLLPISLPPPPVSLAGWGVLGQHFQGEKPSLGENAALAASTPTPEPMTPEMTPEAPLNPVFAAPTPTSGPQLYHQRLRALQGGELHSRLHPSSFYPAWEKVVQHPTHLQWQNLLAEEAKAIARGQGQNRLNIMLGDSLTLWFPTTALSRNAFWLNQGISGENTGQILQRLGALDETRPSTIYIMAGVNDLRQGASDQTILRHTRQILQSLKTRHPQAEIIIQSILPTRLAAIPPERIERLNQAIAQIAQSEGASYLNLAPLFQDETGQLQRELTTDGLHLSPQGYQVWKDVLTQRFRQDSEESPEILEVMVQN
ncbi:lysophospholipase [Spirulina subsalsa FACHB-351]|uniref:Lysophospholipase n=1 Tax=Spirulina subsalsa FACHB-351 TaxID=234711 RepID=A0ABT3LAG3_9CYAN|nr:GDSL-type esterase/lipase family protein [Spirulina subsalsa]MCW6038462.1 lysophospholipase [Spirulina subsalsa FACHB-351]